MDKSLFPFPKCSLFKCYSTPTQQRPWRALPTTNVSSGWCWTRGGRILCQNYHEQFSGRYHIPSSQHAQAQNRIGGHILWHEWTYKYNHHPGDVPGGGLFPAGSHRYAALKQLDSVSKFETLAGMKDREVPCHVLRAGDNGPAVGIYSLLRGNDLASEHRWCPSGGTINFFYPMYFKDILEQKWIFGFFPYTWWFWKT